MCNLQDHDTITLFDGSKRKSKCYVFVANILGLKEGDTIPQHLTKDNTEWDLNIAYGRNCMEQGLIPHDHSLVKDNPNTAKVPFVLHEKCPFCDQPKLNVVFRCKLPEYPKLGLWYVDCFKEDCQQGILYFRTIDELNKYYKYYPYN